MTYDRSANQSTNEDAESLAFKEFERCLADIAAKAEVKRSVTRKLESARAALQSERERLAALRREMEREHRDVTRLEGLSLANLFRQVLGDRASAIDKEREEYLRAKLHHDQAQQAVDALQEDVRALSARLAACGNPEADLRALLRKKEELLLSAESGVASELLQVEEERGRAEALRRELREAIVAGENVHAGLEGVLDSLGSAHGWGIWDMLGGGLISTAVKHSHLDKARDRVHHVQNLMQRFRRELADVAGSVPDIEIGGFARFADYFFDGLFVDWMVQSKINESTERTRQQLSSIEAVLRSLRVRLRDAEATLRRLGERRQALLLKPSGE